MAGDYSPSPHKDAAKDTAAMDSKDPPSRPVPPEQKEVESPLVLPICRARFVNTVVDISGACLHGIATAVPLV